jgi:hypothetical protein
MTGSTISTYVTQTVTLGSPTYPSPLTITGTVDVSTGNGVFAGTAVSNPTLVNDGDVNAMSTGVVLLAGGTVSNTGTISGAGNGIYLGNGGYIRNQNIISGGVGAINTERAASTIVNTGMISGYSYAVFDGIQSYVDNQNMITADSIAVWLGDDGTVANTGTILATAASGGFIAGVLIEGAYGDVNNSSTAALISSAQYGVYVYSTLAVVRNDGTITGGAGTTGIGVLVGTLSGTGTATVQNTGTAAYIGGGSIGVDIKIDIGTVTNAGTIKGLYADGVYLGAGGIVTNTGTAALISGGYGVAIAGATGTILNHGTIYGSIAGAELAGGGTINNAGTNALIYGFETGVFTKAETATIINAGTIEGSFGALLGAGGYLDNRNRIIGGTAGVAAFDGGTVMNAGTAAYIVGKVGVYINTIAGTVINAGTIKGLAASVGGDGILLGNGGTVTNTGVITETGTAANNAGIIIAGAGSVDNKTATALIYGFQGILMGDGLGTVVNHGTIKAMGDAGVVLESGGTVTNASTGTISGPGYGIMITGATASVSNAGTISGGIDAALLKASTSNHLIVDVGADFIGNVVATTTASNTLEVAQGPAAGPGTLFGIGSQFTGFGTIDFDAGTDWTLGGNIAGLGVGQVINGFTVGDTIDLSGSGAIAEVSRLATTSTLTESFADNFLTLYSGGAEFAALNLNELPTVTSKDFEVFSDGNGGTDIVMVMPCYCTGTKILTPTGEVNVEDIRVGDTVITVRDNGPVTGRVTWTGRRSLDIARHPNPDAMHPIRIVAGAFAPGLPERDLRLSPHHALYIDGVLMEAISLVNGATVIQEFDTNFVTYHHIALESHDVILAEGLPAETYLETGHRNMFEGEASLVLHPNFQILGDADFCAPMIRAGAKLEAARARLLARAELLGFFKTDEIDLAVYPRHGRA